MFWDLVILALVIIVVFYVATFILNLAITALVLVFTGISMLIGKVFGRGK